MVKKEDAKFIVLVLAVSKTINEILSLAQGKIYEWNMKKLVVKKIN